MTNTEIVPTQGEAEFVEYLAYQFPATCGHIPLKQKLMELTRINGHDCSWWQVEAEKQRVRAEELDTQLSAWHSIFCTSQLSHAQARLEQAEKDRDTLKRENEELRARLAKVEGVVDAATIWSQEPGSILRQADLGSALAAYRAAKGEK